MIDVVTVDTPQLGNRSYLVHDGVRALVVDPPRDFERLERTAEDAGIEIAAVAETHLHNDFVSGAPALARRHGVEHFVAADEQVSFRRRGIAHGDVFEVGGLEVEVLSTPGHTPGHVAYAACSDASTPVLFTGGSLLYGTVGRTDLSGAEQTERLARAQYRSVRSLAERFPAETALFPTHGFGSFCASSSACSASSSTIAAEAFDNVALTVDDEDRFVRDLLAGLGPVPAYYDHMAGLNRAGHGLEPVARPQLVGGPRVTLVAARPRRALWPGFGCGPCSGSPTPSPTTQSADTESADEGSPPRQEARAADSSRLRWVAGRRLSNATSSGHSRVRRRAHTTISRSLASGMIPVRCCSASGSVTRNATWTSTAGSSIASITAATCSSLSADTTSAIVS